MRLAEGLKISGTVVSGVGRGRESPESVEGGRERAREGRLRLGKARLRRALGRGVGRKLPVPGLVEVVVRNGLRLGGIKLRGLVEVVRGWAVSGLFHFWSPEVSHRSLAPAPPAPPAHRPLAPNAPLRPLVTARARDDNAAAPTLVPVRTPQPLPEPPPGPHSSPGYSRASGVEAAARHKWGRAGRRIRAAEAGLGADAGNTQGEAASPSGTGPRARARADRMPQRRAAAWRSEPEPFWSRGRWTRRRDELVEGLEELEGREAGARYGRPFTATLPFCAVIVP